MTLKTITSRQFIDGQVFCDLARLQHSKGQHSFRAHMEGRSIVVQDASGQVVKVNYGSTADGRSVSAHIDGIGFIGGWQYPHKAQPWSALADSINRGILYHSLAMLPRTHRVKTCPHCGGEL